MERKNGGSLGSTLAMDDCVGSRGVGGDGDNLTPVLFPQTGEFQKLHSVLTDGGDRFGVSTVAIDQSEELIWVGNQGGHVTSYYGNTLEKYTSFQVHPSQEIRHILTADDFILILSQSQLRAQLRRGIPVFTHTSENMLEMQCMLQTSSSTILMGGHQHDLVELDLTTVVETQTIQLDDLGGCAILRSQGRLICTGEPTGKIHLLDSRTFRKEQTIDVHSGSLSDFDVHGNLMVTCGFSNRHSNLSVDRFLKVYDIRMLRALAPIPVSIDPFLLRFLPSFSSRIATVSPSGQMEILETQTLSQTNICLYQVTTAAMCLSFDVSSSCHQMAFGDSNGMLHLFSSNPSSMFNSFSRDTEFPDPVDAIHLPQMSILDEMASLATIPLFFPNNNSSLASDWPAEFCTPAYRKIPTIDPIILQSMKMVGPIGYAPNPGTFRRNQMQYTTTNNQGVGDTNEDSSRQSPVTSSTNSITIVNNNKHHHFHQEDSGGHWSNNNGLSGSGVGSPMNHSAFPPLQYNTGTGNPPHPPQSGSAHGVSSHVKHHHTSHHHHPHTPTRPLPHHHPFPPPPIPGHPIPPQPHQFPPSGGLPAHPPFFYNGPHPQPPPMIPPPPNLGGPPVRPPPYYHKANPVYMKSPFYPGKRSGFHGGSRYSIPKRYAKYEWKKHFFEESDMESFNRTKFSGLEFTQANSYCNSILQILYHTEYLRVALISHLCEKEACLSCELGFLFHMLDNAKTVPCVASNFLRAFRVVPEASALGLILQENQIRQRGIFLRLVQSFNRFLLHQIESETEKAHAEVHERLAPITKLFAMKQKNVNRCIRCGREEAKETTVLLSNILYSSETSFGGRRCGFVDLIQRSLCPEHTSPAWCEKCGKYQPTYQSRVPKALPPLLSLNTCLDNAHDFQIWRNHMEIMLIEKGGKSDVEALHKGLIGSSHPKSCRYGRNCMRPDCKFWHEGRSSTHTPPGRDHSKVSDFETNPETQVKWLPTSIRVEIEDGKKVTCVDTGGESGSDLSMTSTQMDRVIAGNIGDYELMAVICFVRDPDSEEKNNLVGIIQVDGTYFDRAGQSELKSNWLLFNDFCIREVPISEAHSFNPKWKIPCVVYYRKKREQMKESIPFIPPITPTVTVDVFKKVASGKSNDIRAAKKLTYKPLESDEIPTAGQLVAMDAEFVTLGQEETEVRSDGKIATIRPQMAVARVTCVRGQGELEGAPFLDDYISTQEVVVDYLTKFSGIQPGDLDVNYSSKKVTMLKQIYLKLRFLVDSGVKFVGHGLNNDFKMINLAVPPDQIIDTVNLFYLPNQRMISLRFLAWHFLGEVIQSEVHDSIEDARTALRLYRTYEELKNSKKLQEELEKLYETGKKVQWKVPSSTGSSGGDTATTGK